MALDSEAKRWSMLQLASGPGRSHVINPTGSDADSREERLTFLVIYGGTLAAALATSITISGITGGKNLSSLSYVVFDSADIGVGSVIKQGNNETTDANGDLVIDITGLGVTAGTTLTVIITNYTTSPASSNRGAVCYGDAA